MINRRMILAQALMMAQMYQGLNGPDRSSCVESPKKENHPWDKIQLSKTERRWKTYDELQDLRKKKWEEINADN